MSEPLAVDYWHSAVAEGLEPHVAALGTAEFLRSALEGAEVGTWQLDMATGLVTWDEVTSRIFGLPERPMTTGALLPIHDDDRGRMAASLESSFRKGTPHDQEFRGVRPDGEIRWLRGLARPLPDCHRPRQFLAGIVYDVTERRIAASALAESERQLRAILDALPGIAYRCAIKSPWRMTFVSEAIQVLSGFGQRDFIEGEKAWADIVFADDRPQLEQVVAEAVASGSSYSVRYRIVRRDGEVRWVQQRGKAAYDEDGKPLCLEGFVGDVHEQFLADQRLRETEERYRLAGRATMDLIWDWDLRTDHLTWNEAIGICFGYRQQDLGSTGQWWSERIHPGDRERILSDVEAFLRSGAATYTGEYRFRRADGRYAEIFDRGHVIRDEHGRPVRMVGAMQDLTERKEAERQLLFAATRDPLTHLPNRTLFRTMLEETLSSADLGNGRIAVLLFDLDDFKQVNDSLGHDAGDALLQTFAARLSEAVSEEDFVARLGGDEFAVIIRGVPDNDELKRRCALILKALRQPFVHEGSILDCGATVGAAVFPQHGLKPQDLLKHADIALYVAKASAKGDLVIFDSEHRARLQERLAMVHLARSASRSGQILPYYQPKVRLADGSIYGFEALLRWKNTASGPVRLPGGIAAAFDDLEIASAISEQMIDQVVADLDSWLSADLPFGHVALNAAAAEFRRDDFAERLLARLEKAKISTRFLQLEVTETVFLGRGAECVDRALKQLSAAGVKIALDDFGTGYASLRHLKQFPVDVLKIDRSFVAGMRGQEGDNAIVDAVLHLGRSLGIEVVAEGIETKEQEAILKALGCEFGQGFLYSQAIPAGQLRGLFKGSAAPAGGLAA